MDTKKLITKKAMSFLTYSLPTPFFTASSLTTAMYISISFLSSAITSSFEILSRFDLHTPSAAKRLRLFVKRTERFTAARSSTRR